MSRANCRPLAAKMENGAILEDDSVNLTVRIPLLLDCAHNAHRLKRANGTGPFGGVV